MTSNTHPALSAKKTWHHWALTLPRIFVIVKPVPHAANGLTGNLFTPAKNIVVAVPWNAAVESGGGFVGRPRRSPLRTHQERLTTGLTK